MEAKVISLEERAKVEAKSYLEQLLSEGGRKLSGISQNRPLKIEISGFKTSHFWKGKQPWWASQLRGQGMSKCPESERFDRARRGPANDVTFWGRATVKFVYGE
jgi:hypothetical protein